MILWVKNVIDIVFIVVGAIAMGLWLCWIISGAIEKYFKSNDEGEDRD